MSRRSKPWFESKTIWINLASFVVGALLLVVNTEGLGISEADIKIILVAIALLNLFLRTMTTQPITLPGAPDRHT